MIPTWKFCPFADRTDCPGTCSQPDTGMRCEHLILAEINQKHYNKGEEMNLWPHLCPITKEIHHENT